MGGSNSTYKYSNDGSPIQINDDSLSVDDGFEENVDMGVNYEYSNHSRSLTPTHSNNYSYEYEQGFQEGIRYALSYMEQQQE